MQNEYKGFYGEYGGQFVPETLIPALDDLENKFNQLNMNKDFIEELESYLKDYAGRPTPLYHAKNLSKQIDVNVYLKREDLLHTGAHKLNNTLGQGLLVKYMKKNRIIAETGAGQHGVATATIAALLGLDCTIYMGAVDVARQQPNVKRIKMLGADVIVVKTGSKTLKDATNEALKDWVANVETTHYLIGSVVGPHPFPEIVSFFQSVIGKETKISLTQKNIIPDVIIACVGGGSNAIGMFKEFINDNVELIGVEAGGTSDIDGNHAKTLTKGRKGILHGSLSYLLQDENSQVMNVHSISAGLDYPGVGPEHSYLKDIDRVQYRSVRDDDALNAFKLLAVTEGIIPAMESSHAIAYLLNNKEIFNRKNVIVNLSGRGDKDMPIIDMEKKT